MFSIVQISCFGQERTCTIQWGNSCYGKVRSQKEMRIWDHKCRERKRSTRNRNVTPVCFRKWNKCRRLRETQSNNWCYNLYLYPSWLWTLCLTWDNSNALSKLLVYVWIDEQDIYGASYEEQRIGQKDTSGSSSNRLGKSSCGIAILSPH